MPSLRRCQSHWTRYKNFASRQQTTTPIKGRRRAGRYRSSPRAVRISFMAQRTNTIAILIRARTIISLSSRSCRAASRRSEEHTSELQSHSDLVCRLLLEKKKKKKIKYIIIQKDKNRI